MVFGFRRFVPTDMVYPNIKRCCHSLASPQGCLSKLHAIQASGNTVQLARREFRRHNRIGRTCASLANSDVSGDAAQATHKQTRHTVSLSYGGWSSSQRTSIRTLEINRNHQSKLDICGQLCLFTAGCLCHLFTQFYSGSQANAHLLVVVSCVN